MNQRIKLTSKDARPFVEATFPDYTGRKFSASIGDKVSFYDTNWSGGTCNKYAVVTRNGDKAGLLAPAPWVNPMEGATVNLPSGVFVVEHSFFCGHDMGITIYVNPADAPKWITA